MAKAKKESTPKPKKRSKYDMTVKLNMSFEEAIKLAATTPPQIQKNKKITP